jgi:hypothetical protein
MATRFVRVDLSEEARDYRPIAVEPGVAMLDRSGANARIIFRWLGGMVAEPVWEDDLVGFYVRDDQGGRLEDVYCQPATNQDLQGGLRDDLAKLRQRLESARGETTTERTLRKVLMRSFQDVVDRPGRTDQDSYFFKYKDVLGNWRLVWCWGYERLDQEPAPAVVCTDPDCNLLFVRRPGKNPRCPACSGAIVPRKKKKSKRSLAALLLLLLLLLALGLWLLVPTKLIATPATLTGTVGSKIDCQIVERSWWFRNKEVTHEAAGFASDQQVAKFDNKNGAVRLTGEGSTVIEFRYNGRSTQVSVTATASPDANKVVSLELTPAGPIDLPLGQMKRLQAYANYGDGRRAEVPSEQVKWSAEKSVPGLELYRDSEVVGAVGATKAGAGPLSVFATYRGQESNRVAFKSVDADPNVKLAIDVDRTLRIAGEGGRAVLSASTPKGDVELIPSLAKFESASDKILKFAGKPGKFAAVSPGRSMVTGTHIAAKGPAKLEFQVCDPAKAKLVFDPPSVTVPVNEKADLKLTLEAELDEGGKKETLRAAMLGPDVAYSIAQPDAVRMNPPTVTGLKPAAAFAVRGQIPILAPANATVAVVDSAAKKLRITPTAVSPLAAGQSSALIVEQQVGDADVWKEVSPDKVTWKVPDNVTWTKPTEGLRPTITLPSEFKGEANLEATVGGTAASIAFALKPAGPDATTAQLVLNREADGKYLEVGKSQRYSVLVEKDGKSEPVTDVHWPADFENDYVKWEAPVLTAKREGYTQYLHADVAGRNVLWHTTTYRPGEFVETETKQKPDWVKIFSQQGSQHVQSVRFPVGATFTDFKVEVHYPDGYTRFVTKKAFLTTPDSPGTAPLTADHGKLIGLRTGKTKINAEFQGIVSKEPLEAEVLADVDIDKVAIEPGSAQLMPGETYELHAIGYKNGQSVGDITGLGNLTWKSSNSDVARIAGNSVIASNIGDSQITVERKGLTSAPALVTVAKTFAEELRVLPGVIEMPQGSSLQLGSDVQVLRGNLDVSQQANVTPESPGVVEFDPVSRTLRAKNMGQVTIGVTEGDKLARAVVRVGPPPILAGKLVVEPGSIILAPGQADRLSVYVETPSGERVDETGVALFKSGETSIAAVDDGIARIKALKPGKSNIMVVVANMPPLSVPLEVTSEEIKEVTVDPAREEMAVSEVKPLRVFGRADKSGLKELFPQPDLKTVPRKTDVVDVSGDVVRGKAIGDDTIDVAWRDKLKIEVPAKVTANELTGLRIDPTDATINTNEGKTYEVSAMRSGNRVVLTERDGVQLNVTDPGVAAVATGNTVISRAPGQTKVIATLGSEKAEATLNVTLAPPGGLPAGRTDVIGEGGVIYRPGGERIYIGGRSVSEIPPSGNVVALQWEPQLFQKGVQAIPQTAQLHRRYENGGFDDVSNDPSVEITKQPNPTIAKMEKVDGGWKISPVGPGVTTVAAKFGGLTAQMNVEINGDAGPGGTLILNPSAISLWSGQTAVIAGAELDPGNGLPHVPTKVKITAPDNQGIVSADGDKITGRSPGDAIVTVTAENGSSAPLSVHVTPPDTITLNPPDNNLQVGDKVSPSVMAQSAAGGDAVAVPVPIESLDTKHESDRRRSIRARAVRGKVARPDAAPRDLPRQGSFCQGLRRRTAVPERQLQLQPQRQDDDDRSHCRAGRERTGIPGLRRRHSPEGKLGRESAQRRRPQGNACNRSAQQRQGRLPSRDRSPRQGDEERAAISVDARAIGDLHAAERPAAEPAAEIAW